jgi:hypothetical protein
MTTDQILQLLLRLLPSLLVLGLGFFAASDAKTRERWTGLLYQMGSLRPEQRDDPKAQSGVRIPFFVVSALLLIWPIQYYRHITTVFEISPAAYGQRDAKFDPYGGKGTATTPGVAGTPAPGTTMVPGAATTSPYGAPATAAPPVTAPTFSPYGNSTAP